MASSSLLHISSAYTAARSNPLLSTALLLALLLPIFNLLFVYFFPLLVSTALCMLLAALLSVGGSLSEEEGEEDHPGAFSRAQKRVRGWLRRMVKRWESSEVVRSEYEPDLLPEVEDDEEGIDAQSEQEKRVKHLERTLRTLSFVSFEGIFAADGTLIEEDPVSKREEAGNVGDGDEAQANCAAAEQPTDPLRGTSSSTACNLPQLERVELQQQASDDAHVPKAEVPIG